MIDFRKVLLNTCTYETAVCIAKAVAIRLIPMTMNIPVVWCYSRLFDFPFLWLWTYLLYDVIPDCLTSHSYDYEHTCCMMLFQTVWLPIPMTMSIPVECYSRLFDFPFLWLWTYLLYDVIPDCLTSHSYAYEHTCCMLFQTVWLPIPMTMNIPVECYSRLFDLPFLRLWTYLLYDVIPDCLTVDSYDYEHTCWMLFQTVWLPIPMTMNITVECYSRNASFALN